LEDHRNTAIWTRSYSGPLNETAEAIQRTLDDGYIVAGTSESLSTTRDGWIAKLDWKGNALWQRLLDGGASVVSIHSISANTNGSYTAAGEIDGDMLVLNLSSDGNIQWQKKYGGSQNDFARSILQTPDGGYIVAGSTNSFNLINQGAWVLKLDINGEIQWQRVLDSPAGIDELHSIIRDWGSYQQGTGLFSGGYLAVGFTSEAGNRDLWVVRLKENGDINWQKRYGGSGDDEGAAILNVWGSDANSVRQYVIVGSTKSYGNGQKDVWVTKIDGNGAILWQKTYGGSNDEEATAIQLTLSQGAIITGGTKSFSAGDEDLFALNLKDDGSLLWQRRYGESGNETARAVDRAYGGGYVIVGSATSFGNGSDDMWILRTDDSGNAGLNCATGTATDAGTTDSTALAINASLTSTVSTAQAELLELTQSPASLSAGNQCGSFILNCQSDYLVASSTQNAAAICTVTSVSGYAGPVLLSCPDLPSGATCSFSPSFVDLSPNGFAATDLTVHVEPVDLENRYTFTIQGTEGAAVRTWIEQLEIQKEISITDPTIWEGNTGTSTMDFDLSLIAPKPGVASVDYFTSDGSATAGTDYTPVSGTLVFEPGETTKRISVIVNGDTIFENDETFFLNLTNPSNVSLDDLVAMAIMKNDEAKPSVTIQDLAVTEPSSGVLNANVIVKLSNAISLPAKVHYATVDNSATAGSDYVSAAGDLTIPAGSTSGNISLVILGDAIAEGAENFKVRLSAPVNSLITDSEAQVTISNKKPAISIQDKKRMEGNSGTTNAVFSVVLSFAYNVNCSANFVTAQSTALAGKDFTAASGTLTIPAGSTTGTIQVPVAGETLYETDETFKVNLSNAVNATFSDSSGLGTIQNDDSIPSLTIDDVSVLEGVAGTANLTFTVRLSAASGLKTTVRFSTAPNTATSGSGDYVQKSGTVTIPAGSLFGTIIIGINGDAILEPNETFFVNLNTPTNATIADSQGIGTIVNDD